MPIVIPDDQCIQQQHTYKPLNPAAAKREVERQLGIRTLDGESAMALEKMEEVKKEAMGQQIVFETRKATLVAQIDDVENTLASERESLEIAKDQLQGANSYVMKRWRALRMQRDDLEVELAKSRAYRRDAESALLLHIEDVTRSDAAWEKLHEQVVSYRNQRVDMEEKLRDMRAWRKAHSGEPGEAVSPEPGMAVSPEPGSLPDKASIEQKATYARHSTITAQQRAKVLGKALAEARQKMGKPAVSTNSTLTEPMSPLAATVKLAETVKRDAEPSPPVKAASFSQTDSSDPYGPSFSISS